MTTIGKLRSLLCGVLLAAVLGLPAAAQDKNEGESQEKPEPPVISESHLNTARKAVAASQATRALDRILPSLGAKAKEQLISGRPDVADQINAIVDEATIALAPRRGILEDRSQQDLCQGIHRGRIDTARRILRIRSGQEAHQGDPDRHQDYRTGRQCVACRCRARSARRSWQAHQ